MNPPEDGMTCPGNIQGREIRVRFLMGAAFSGASFYLAAKLFSGPSVPPVQLLFFVLCVFFTVLGFAQSRARTCVYHAWKGQSASDEGIRRIGKESLKARLRRRGNGILLVSLLISLSLAGALLLARFLWRL